MLQMHLIENIFFPISRISISLEVNFVLIEREGLIFLFKYVFVKRPFFVTVHFAETLWTHLAVGGKYPGCQEQQSHSSQSNSTCVPQVPALDTQPQLLQRSSAWAAWQEQEGAGASLGHRGCQPSFPARASSGWLAAEQACLQGDTAAQQRFARVQAQGALVYSLD